MGTIFNIKLKEIPILKTDEIHIWVAFLPDYENSLAFFTSLLSPFEHKRAYSFKLFRDYKQFTIARGILKCLLAQYLGDTPHTIEIQYGPWGKPYLSKEAPLHFNLSHSREYALYALTRNYELGIDIEYIDEKLSLDDIVSTIFSHSEIKCWKNLSPKDKLTSFFRYWVCNEALLKASGKGWLEEENKLPFEKGHALRYKSRIDILTKKKKLGIYPYCFDCIPGYVSALFVKGPPLRPFQYTWHQENLEVVITI